MNRTILIGRLVKDPELQHTNSNIAVCKFTLAVNRPFTSTTGERKADFLTCVAWKNNAENLCKYMSKGSQIAVEGRIEGRDYTDNNGVKRYATEIVVESLHFLESKKGIHQQPAEGSYYQQMQQQAGQAPKQEISSQNGSLEELANSEYEVSMDDLPF